MRTLRRRRVIVPAAVAIVVAVVAGTAWYLLSDGRRMGLTVERTLVQRTGLPIKVERAFWKGQRLLLRGVHLEPAATFPLDVRVSELTIDSGIMFLVAPSRRTISMEAKSASLTMTDWPAVPGGGIEALRAEMLSFLGWSGTVVIRAPSAELRTPAGALTFDLTANKLGPGLALELTILAPGESDALRVKVRSAAALGRALDVVVDVTGSPRVIAVVWAGAPPPASPVTARVQSQILAGGVVSSFGRLAIGASHDRRALELTSRYDPTSGELGVSRYALAWGEAVRLSGTARLAGDGARRRLSATAVGTAAGSKVSATGGYEPASGAFDADVTLDGADAGRVARRLGLGVPTDARARSVRARLSGLVEAKTMKALVDPAASRVTTRR